MERDAGTLPCEGHRRRRADARTRAGDEDALASKIIEHIYLQIESAEFLRGG
jgi:hypothetical protein